MRVYAWGAESVYWVDGGEMRACDWVVYVGEGGESRCGRGRVNGFSVGYIRATHA